LLEDATQEEFPLFALQKAHEKQHRTTFPLGTFPARFLFWGRSKIQGQNMLFDERPKEDRRELFGRDKEVEELKRAAKRPLVVLTGIRRIGKTSVLKVALKEMNRPSILIDARGWDPTTEGGSSMTCLLRLSGPPCPGSLTCSGR
ncbi:MAG: hypothetical protein QXH26_04050, partial [Candidatus Hadarchaeales archaeon]